MSHFWGGLHKLADAFNRPGFSLWDGLYIVSCAGAYNGISNMHDRTSASGIAGIVLLVIIPLAFLWFAVRGRSGYVVKTKTEMVEDLADRYKDGYEDGFAASDRFARQREALRQAKQ